MQLDKTICLSCGKLVFIQAGICELCGSGLSPVVQTVNVAPKKREPQPSYEWVMISVEYKSKVAA